MDIYSLPAQDQGGYRAQVMLGPEPLWTGTTLYRDRTLAERSGVKTLQRALGDLLCKFEHVEEK